MNKERRKEIHNWINKNIQFHKWDTNTMLDMYAKHYLKSQSNIDIDKLDKLDKQISETLDNETNLSLNEWLEKTRK